MLKNIELFLFKLCENMENENIFHRFTKTIKYVTIISVERVIT